MNGFEAAAYRHQRKVFTFARYYLGSSEEAEDVTQEVLIKLWQHQREIADDGQHAWIMQVTRNACFDRLRRRRSAARVFQEDPEERAAAKVPANDPDPEARAAASDFQHHLRLALEQLKDPMKSIVILREIQGLKYQEIAEALEIPLNTVRVYLHRGRQRLREQLREVYGHAS